MNIFLSYLFSHHKYNSKQSIKIKMNSRGQDLAFVKSSVDKNIKYEIIHIDISNVKNIIDTLNEMILLLHENGYLFIHHENVNFEQKIEMDCFLNIEKMNCNIYVEMSIIVLEKITHK